MSHAGNLDLVLGAYTGFFYLFVNTMLPEFAQRTGSANPFDGTGVGESSRPALGDLDGDGTLRPCPSIDDTSTARLP